MMALHSDQTGTGVSNSEMTMLWQVGLLMGIFWLVLGLIVAFHPTTSLNVLCVLMGIIVLFGGIVRLVRALNASETRRALTAVVGLLMVALGLVLIRHLHMTRLLVALIVGVVFIVQGVADIFAGASIQLNGRRVWWLIVLGIVSVAAGIVVLCAPENSITFLATLVGVWFAVVGALELIVSFIFRHELHKGRATVA